MSNRNSVHHNKQQFGYHIFVEEPEEDDPEDLLEILLQFVKDVSGAETKDTDFCDDGDGHMDACGEGINSSYKYEAQEIIEKYNIK